MATGAVRIVYRAREDASGAYIARVEKLKADREEAIAAFLSRHGFPEGTPMWGNDRATTGVMYRVDQAPVGWRILREDPGVLVPARRTVAGREIARQLSAIPFSDRRKELPGSMPDIASNRDHTFFISPGSGVYGGHLYVYWSDELDERDAGRIDPSVWERVPLSIYYLAVEQHEREAVSADG
ncbi:hypothetical protein [Nocardiopsis synnemataformans]|uniref:hypothetical protein n=1 Tax=Nocardiopsis synnemataformans TaxID=61305 RepID=UPI003EBA8B14